MKQVPVMFCSCNAIHITNKMPTLVHDTLKEAQKMTLILDIVEKGKEGNRAIIYDNNPEGWILYKSIALND